MAQLGRHVEVRTCLGFVLEVVAPDDAEAVAGGGVVLEGDGTLELFGGFLPFAVMASP